MDEVPIPDELVESEEMRERVKWAIDNLHEEHARVLILRYYRAMPVTRIAEQLAESRKATESRLARAREAFRRLLGGEYV
jgi:RNA polymerase sigma-70 factor (ECF subfamily)